MTFNEYQIEAEKTATYPRSTTKDALTYLGLGLTGEAGEVADKIKKWLRVDYPLTPQKREEIILELGDQLWYISEIARELEYELQEVAEMNVKKLKDRQERNRLHGDGDYR